MKPVKAYKIVDKIDNDLFFLYHGINGSRKIVCNTWLIANNKTVIDGSGGKQYLSGFHVFLSKQTAKEYLKKFTKPYKYIVPVCALGLRVKHGNNQVYLADKIILNKHTKQRG